MKKSRILALGGVTLLSAAVLAACGNGSSSSSSAPTTYTYAYTSDPESLNYLLVNKSTTGDIIGNVVDGLLENDEYGNFVPSLAEDWTVSQDGLTYTYTLRDDAKWFTVEGEEYANVTAEDFVTGLKYAADHSGDAEALYLVQNSIAGLDAYVKGETKDFSTVGIKAIDEKTVQYTLTQPEPYWNSKLTTGILFPVNAEFLESKGDDFGSADPSSILYSGPYLISAMTAKSSLEYTKNPNYWDADKVAIENIKLTYTDGSDISTFIDQFEKGVFTASTILPNASNYSSVKEKFADNIIYGQQNGTVFYGAINVNRTSYKHTAKTTDAEKESTKKALLNKDFRQALNFAISRANYHAQAAGEDAKTKGIRNMLTAPTFVNVGDQTYGDVFTEKMAAIGSEWKDIDFSDAQDSLYNPEKAKAEFDKAKKELEAQGVTFPIRIDIPALQTSDLMMSRVGSIKESIESALGAENVQIDILPMDEDPLYAATFHAENASQEDYDISTVSGWGPDFQDPSTYLDIFNPASGDTLKIIGIDAGSNPEIVKTLGLEKLNQQLTDAAKETSDVAVRYSKYAEAEATLADASVLLPIISAGGRPSVTKAVPYTSSFSWTGIKGSVSYKYLKLQENAVTVKEYEAAREKWLKEKAESNAKAQEDLAKHVK
ncbi:peptide ABC transporter substrate-binding protein [Streptococcus sp. E17BB]|uniref:peptide ABC transporter substrate-binding protein n=1 Tax=Streptococcus sp. E17BB TaxID=3278714 RepID=UPI00359D4B1D